MSKEQDLDDEDYVDLSGPILGTFVAPTGEVHPAEITISGKMKEALSTFQSDLPVATAGQKITFEVECVSDRDVFPTLYEAMAEHHRQLTKAYIEQIHMALRVQGLSGLPVLFCYEALVNSINWLKHPQNETVYKKLLDGGVKRGMGALASYRKEKFDNFEQNLKEFTASQKGLELWNSFDDFAMCEIPEWMKFFGELAAKHPSEINEPDEEILDRIEYFVYVFIIARLNLFGAVA